MVFSASPSMVGPVMEKRVVCMPPPLGKTHETKDDYHLASESSGTRDAVSRVDIVRRDK